MARWVRIGTGLYLALALPGLIFGFLVKVDRLPLPCEPTGSTSWLDTWLQPTSGVACQTFDLAFLYWLVPALAILVIGIGIGAARRPRMVT